MIPLPKFHSLMVSSLVSPINQNWIDSKLLDRVHFSHQENLNSY